MTMLTASPANSIEVKDLSETDLGAFSIIANTSCKAEMTSNVLRVQSKFMDNFNVETALRMQRLFKLMVSEENISSVCNKLYIQNVIGRPGSSGQ
jgi:hypothetical protein